MSIRISAPLLLSVLVSLLLGLIGWGFLRLHFGKTNDSLLTIHDNHLMLGLLILAVVALCTFLVYALLNVGI